ncbi:MAG TPA: Gfo/Idh/MocA family oxidoreductase [Chthoniobacteraceae bacterium]|nr:Gfo/Idh/MocA family oxidoreductase [Chthoniobacteraceae bacterium]
MISSCAPLTKTVRLAFVGTGSFSTGVHLPSAASSPGVEIRALCDLDETVLETLSRVYRPAYLTTCLDEVLADREVDAVVLATRQDTHAALSLQCLEAGKRVYVEKPIGENRRDLLALWNVRERYEGALAVGFNRRFSPIYRHAKAALAGRKGPVFMTCRMLSLPRRLALPYYRDRSNLVFEGGHLFDLALSFIASRPVSVMTSGEAYRSHMTVVSFEDGSRFCLHMNEHGSADLGKEYVEIHQDGVSISCRDFYDLRVRGVKGMDDRIFPPEPFVGSPERETFDSADAVEVFFSRGKRGETRVRRPGFHRSAADMEEALKGVFGTPLPGLIVPQKGWKSALIGFLFADPGNAWRPGIREAVRATWLSLRALQSLETACPVELGRDDPPFAIASQAGSPATS